MSDHDGGRAHRTDPGDEVPRGGPYAMAPLSPSRIGVLRGLKRAAVIVLVAGGATFVLWFVLHFSLTPAFFPAWLGTAAVVVAAVSGLAVPLWAYPAVALSSHGATRPEERPWHLQPSTPLVLSSSAAMVVLCIWLTFSLDTVAPAMILGAHPARTTADAVTLARATCRRCEDQLVVSFHTSTGRVVTARMPGSSFVPVSVGESLVYDEQSPARVTTERAWVAGRSDQRSPIESVVAMTVLMGLLVRRARRRRIRFGDLRPGVPVTSVHRVKATATVRFADGVAATYVATNAFDDALASKVTRDGKPGALGGLRTE